jgi:hypothetical protein
VDDVSRGPGRWQRAILQAIEDTEYEIFPVLNIAYHHLGRAATRSEAVAARRAVKALAIAGKIRAIHYPHPSADGRETLAQLCVTRSDSIQTSRWCRSDVPDWVVWMDGKTQAERNQFNP